MIITCPECRRRCRVMEDDAKSPEGRGKCPECGHVFIIPPGAADKPGRQQKGNEAKPHSTADNVSFPASLFKNNYKIWVGTAVILLLTVASGLLLFPAKEVAPERTIPPANSRQMVSNRLDQHEAALLAEQMRKDPLVGDAAIDFDSGTYFPFLLVTAKTPASSATVLGRRFAHLLREKLPAEQKAKAQIEVSVYYPDGSRLLVACHDDFWEEEILPQTAYPEGKSD